MWGTARLEDCEIVCHRSIEARNELVRRFRECTGLCNYSVNYNTEIVHLARMAKILARVITDPFHLSLEVLESWCISHSQDRIDCVPMNLPSISKDLNLKATNDCIFFVFHHVNILAEVVGNYKDLGYLLCNLLSQDRLPVLEVYHHPGSI